jgi:isopentenyl diphosphate isomerase/L-lactate dehydrogenase-like FMN-dependent dehydrogenase
MPADRDAAQLMLDAAEAAGVLAVCLTVDTPTPGFRERDVRNRLSFPPLVAADDPVWSARPEWTAAYLAGPPSLQPNLAHLPSTTDSLNPSLTWADVEWLRAEWDRPLIVKGILHPDDAVRAVAAGVDGVVVSNDGGRQLDGALSSIAALPAVVAAVGDDAEVFLDGGVRRGTDVARALALDARACLVGRPVLFGLAVGGDDGARRAIELLREELRTTMALLGCAAVEELGPDHVRAAGAADISPRRFVASGP